MGKNLDEIVQLIDNKLEVKLNEFNERFLREMRESFIGELKKEIRNIIQGEVAEISSTVSMLQKQIIELKHTNLELSKQSDDNEQYQRRLCLRLEGIPYSKSESAEVVFKKVEKVLKDAGCPVPGVVFDRAHRIGKVKTNEGGDLSQTTIMRLTTFRHRTLIYRHRGIISEKCGVFVRLDLTRRRLELLKTLRNKVKNNEHFSFIYADINCRIKVRFSNGDDEFVDSVRAFLDILEKKSIRLD